MLSVKSKLSLYRLALFDDLNICIIPVLRNVLTPTARNYKGILGMNTSTTNHYAKITELLFQEAYAMFTQSLKD